MKKDANASPDSSPNPDAEPIAPDMTPDAVREAGSPSDSSREETDGMDEVINEFLVESYENLDQLDQDLVDLEQNPTEKSLLASIFRTIHTIKGTCGFIGFSKLESVAHVGENLLSKLRDGELSLNPPITSALLAMVDAIRQILSCIESSQNEGDVDYSELIGTLTTLQKGESAEVAVPAAPASAAADTQPAGASPEEEGASVYESMGGGDKVESIADVLYSMVLADTRIKDLFEGVALGPLKSIHRELFTHTLGGSADFSMKKYADSHKFLIDKGMNATHFDAMVENIGATLKVLDVPENAIRKTVETVDLIRAQMWPPDSEAEAPAPVEEAPTAPDTAEVPEVSESAKTAETAVAAQGDESVDKSGAAAARQEGRAVAEASIRVDVDLLDRLMNLVGELVLARNQILQFTPKEQDSTFTATTQHLNLVTTELQEGVMKTRMQPIGNIWNKFPRVVRDLAISCGKKVRLEMEGKETELDKTLIEAIKDPLTHIVRNSVDHGIETPEVRKAAGKDEEGVLKLRAYHEGGQVNVEIIDDGGGIDPEKLKKKAIEKNVITPEKAARMSDREVVNLIFAAGFSTAAKVTNVSGRGVGMDVVKTNIEKIGGTVDVQSQKGHGTTLKVKIPLTLAIIPALTVMTGGDRYAIPQVNLLELVRLDGQDAKNAVEMIQGTPVYRLRGNLLPLVYLNDQLKVERKENNDAVNIVVLQADDRQFGLVVEGVNDTEEIVVKPLGKQMKGIPAFAGATIMGDGKVALILDVMGLAQSARVVTETHERNIDDGQDKSRNTDRERHSYLIFGLGEDGRMAIPLSIVARLEEFARQDLEYSGDQEVVQYRGEIMPLIFLSRIFGEEISEGTAGVKETMQAVVYTHNGKSVALVADRIVDIVEETVTVKRNSRRHGTVGTVVLQGKVTDLLDAEGIVKEHDPSFYEEPAMIPA